MTLIGELKEKVEAVESDMEKKAIIAHAGMLLTDDELTEVSGGNQDLGIKNCEESEGPKANKTLHADIPWIKGYVIPEGPKALTDPDMGRCD